MGPRFGGPVGVFPRGQTLSSREERIQYGIPKTRNHRFRTRASLDPRAKNCGRIRIAVEHHAKQSRRRRTGRLESCAKSQDAQDA